MRTIKIAPHDGGACLRGLPFFAPDSHALTSGNSSSMSQMLPDCRPGIRLSFAAFWIVSARRPYSSLMSLMVLSMLPFLWIEWSIAFSSVADRSRCVLVCIIEPVFPSAVRTFTAAIMRTVTRKTAILICPLLRCYHLCRDCLWLFCWRRFLWRKEPPVNRLFVLLLSSRGCLRKAIILACSRAKYIYSHARYASNFPDIALAVFYKVAFNKCAHLILTFFHSFVPLGTSILYSVLPENQVVLLAISA